MGGTVGGLGGVVCLLNLSTGKPKIAFVRSDPLLFDHQNGNSGKMIYGDKTGNWNRHDLTLGTKKDYQPTA